MNPTYETVETLNNLYEQMQELLDLAEQTLQQSGCQGALMRAQSYWLPHMRMALDHNHGYLGGSMVTLADTLAELEQATDEE